jgi:hypothetical protein
MVILIRGKGHGFRFFVDKAHEQEIDAESFFFSKLTADARTMSH